MMPYSRIAVLGAGAWGTALALAAHAAGRDTTLWVREADVLEAMRGRRREPLFAGRDAAAGLAVTGELAVAAKADALLLVVPAQVLHGFADAWRRI